MKKEMTLDEVRLGTSAIVKKMNTTGSIRRRLLDIGLVEGTRVSNVLISPSGDPVAYFIRGAVIAIRKEDARTIVVDAVA